LAAILLATLTPQPDAGVGPDFFAPLRPDPISALRDVVQNVLLYTPLGLLLAVYRWSGLRAVFAAAFFSLTIELLQFVVPGRDPFGIDVLTNATGAAAGYAMARTFVGSTVRRFLLALERSFVWLSRPQRSMAATLSLSWAVLVAGTVWVTGWVLSPAIPPPAFYGVVSPTIDSQSGPARIGGAVGGFRGLIDEVRIYARALTTREIQRDRDEPVSRPSSVDPDLVAAHGFDVDEGGATSDSATGRRAVVQGAAWTGQGRFGAALRFDGRTSQVILAELPNVDRLAAITMEAWLLPEAQPDGEAPVVSLHRDAYHVNASSDGGALVPSAGGRFGSVAKFVRWRRRLAVGRWTHLASTFDGRSIRLYVDGHLAATRRHWSSHVPVRTSLNGIDLPIGPVSDAKTFRSLLSGAFTLRTSILCGDVPDVPAPVFQVTGIQSIDVLSLEAVRTELRVRFPTRARSLGFASPDLRVPKAFAECSPGKTLSFALKGPLRRLQVEDGGDGVLWTYRPGIGSLWAVLVESQIMPVPVVEALTACYLAALVFPFGFWGRTTLRTAVGAVILSAAFFLPGMERGERLNRAGSVAVAVGLALGAGVSRLAMSHGARSPS
jgi:VanZ family protein